MPHYSGYSLIVEPKTVFYNLMNKGQLPLPGEDIESEMFAMLMDQMEKHGRKRYEISNFAVPGYESIHNLIYWENDDVCRYRCRCAWLFERSALFQYRPHCKSIWRKRHAGERPFQQTHVVTETEAMEEEMFLGLRKAKGVSYSLFQQKFGKSLEDVYGETLQSLIREGLVEQSDGT